MKERKKERNTTHAIFVSHRLFNTQCSSQQSTENITNYRIVQSSV